MTPNVFVTCEDNTLINIIWPIATHQVVLLMIHRRATGSFGRTVNRKNFEKDKQRGTI